MFQTHAMNNRRRLCLSASALAIAVTCFGAAGTANAATKTLSAADAGTVYDMDASTDTAVIIPSGLEAMVIPNWASWVLGSDPGLATPSGGTSTLSTCIASWACHPNAPLITVESGGTLRFAGTQTYGSWFASGYIFQSAVAATGDVIIENVGDIQSWGQPAVTFLGANSFLGNVTLYDGAHVNMGWNWAPAQTTFGTNTNIDLQGASQLIIYQSGATMTVGGKISSSSAATIELGSGTLVVNGQNTAASPFSGTITVDGGSSLTIGDATHSTAVFGDPTTSGGVININAAGGSLGVLSGYGTIYATVNNSGIVKPGGTSGTLGTLTVAKYVQSSTGSLQVEVSPTGASKLNVLGSATLDGTMVVKLDAGTYGNIVYNNILSASSITGSFSSITPTGNTAGAIIGVQISSTAYNLVVQKASNSQVVGHLVTANRYDIYDFASSLYDVMSGGTPGGAVAAGSRGKVTVWATPTGRLDNVGRNGAGYGLTSFGLSGGVQYDAAWHNAIIGAAISYDHGSLDVKNEDTKAHSNTVNLAVYGGADVQYARLDGMVFFNTYDAALKRTLVSYGTVVGSPSGWGWGGSVQVSQSLFNDRVTPFVRGTFARVAQDALTESGVDTFDLQYDKITANTFVGDLGVKVNVLPATSKIKLQATVALRHDFSDPGERVEGSFAAISGSTFRYDWKGDSQNTILIGANAGGEVMTNLMVFGRVGGEFSLYRRSVNFGVGAKYHF